MRKIMVIAASLLLAGCGATAEPTPSPAPAPIETVDSAAEFLYDVEQFAPGLTFNAEENAISAGKRICSALRDDWSVTEVYNDIVSSGFTKREAEVIIAASIVNFCPEQELK